MPDVFLNWGDSDQILTVMLAFKNIKAISAIISTHIFKSNLISKEVRQRCIFVRSVPNSFILVSCERYNKVMFAKWFKKSTFY